MSNENEIYIDWSKEPEATHYLPDGDYGWCTGKATFYKQDESGLWLGKLDDGFDESWDLDYLIHRISGSLIPRPPTLLELLVEAHKKGDFEWHPKVEFYYQDKGKRVFGFDGKPNHFNNNEYWYDSGKQVPGVPSYGLKLASDWNVKGVSRAEFEAAVKPKRAYVGRDMKIKFAGGSIFGNPIIESTEIKPLPLTAEQRLEQLRLSIDQIAGALDLTKDKGAKESLQSQLDDLLELQFELLSGEVE